MKNDEKNDPVFMDEKITMRDNVKKAKKEGLTRGSLITAAIAIVLLVAAGIFAYTAYNREQEKQMALMEEERTSFELQLVTRDSTINSWLMTFDQIEKDLSVIKQKEDLITLKSSDVEFSKERKEQILEDIRLINTLLENNKKRIAQLSAQLKKSGTEISGLQNMIASLEASIVQREGEISGLKLALVEKDFEIGQLNNQMTGLQVTVSQQTETISSQTEEMNKAYLVYGTYKDLKEKGILTKEGGFLGLGKREALIEDSPDSLFTRVDITETRLIPVNSKNAKLITNHPSGSYEIIAEGENKIAGIEIKNPDEFWRISRYAVVEIIK
ncbi:MAG: hypothetical protein R6W81_09810 [Bacteroidales bacterium]